MYSINTFKSDITVLFLNVNVCNTLEIIFFATIKLTLTSFSINLKMHKKMHSSREYFQRTTKTPAPEDSFPKLCHRWLAGVARLSPKVPWAGRLFAFNQKQLACSLKCAFAKTLIVSKSKKVKEIVKHCPREILAHQYRWKDTRKPTA